MPKSAPVSTSIHAAPAGSQWAEEPDEDVQPGEGHGSAVRGNGRLCRMAK